MRLGCARTLNDQPGEEAEGVDLIGKFTDSGEILGHFAAQPGYDVVIDHGIGATMSFRRKCLADLGGFREWFHGVSGVCEDTDAFLRARRLGHKAVFVHDAVARHVGAPQVRVGGSTPDTGSLQLGILASSSWRTAGCEIRSSGSERKPVSSKRLTPLGRVAHVEWRAAPSLYWVFCWV